MNHQTSASADCNTRAASNIAVLCLGSNVDDSAIMLRRALDALAPAVFVRHSSQTYSSPSDNGIGADYLNLVAECCTELTLDSLHSLTKQLECELGRTPLKTLEGIIPIDIDIVIFNGSVVKAADFSAPHFTLGYKKIR